MPSVCQVPVLQSEHVDTADQSLDQNTSAPVPCTAAQRGVLSGPSREQVFCHHGLLPELDSFSVEMFEQRCSCAGSYTEDIPGPVHELWLQVSVIVLFWTSGRCSQMSVMVKFIKVAELSR